MEQITLNVNHPNTPIKRQRFVLWIKKNNYVLFSNTLCAHFKYDISSPKVKGQEKTYLANLKYTHRLDRWVYCIQVEFFLVLSFRFSLPLPPSLPPESPHPLLPPPARGVYPSVLSLCASNPIETHSFIYGHTNGYRYTWKCDIVSLYRKKGGSFYKDFNFPFLSQLYSGRIPPKQCGKIPFMHNLFDRYFIDSHYLCIYYFTPNNAVNIFESKTHRHIAIIK